MFICDVIFYVSFLIISDYWDENFWYSVSKIEGPCRFWDCRVLCLTLEVEHPISQLPYWPFTSNSVITGHWPDFLLCKCDFVFLLKSCCNNRFCLFRTEFHCCCWHLLVRLRQLFFFFKYVFQSPNLNRVIFYIHVFQS